MGDGCLRPQGSVFDDRRCLQFRRYAGSDRRAVLSLNVVALEHSNAFVDVADYYGDLHDIPASYLAGGGEFLIGQIGGEVVAMGGLQLRTYGIAEVKRMRVLPNRQGCGIGRRLLTALEDAARDRGCRHIELDTTVNQPAAQQLFTSHGYAEVRHGNKGGLLESIFYAKALA